MYKIVVYDNAHYMDASEAYTLEGFDRYDDALQKAREIVREDLRELYAPVMDSASLYEAYRLYGSDPVIAPPLDRDEQFSAWQFAAAEAALICAEKKGDTEIPVQVVGRERRISNVQLAPFGYYGNEQEFLRRSVLALHYFGKKCFRDFEVPLSEWLKTDQMPWYASRTDIGGFQDYSLEHRFAYFPGNRFAGIHLDVCDSTGYNRDEACVRLRALGVETDRMVYIEVEMDTGLALICFTEPAEPIILSDLFTRSESGLMLPAESLFAAPAVSAPAPNDFFKNDPGFHVVVFHHTLYRDLRLAELFKGFPSEEDALQKAREAVEKSVYECFRPFYSSAGELFQHYMEQGKCPVVFSTREECDFDAWAYARVVCERQYNPAYRPS